MVPQLGWRLSRPPAPRLIRDSRQRLHDPSAVKSLVEGSARIDASAHQPPTPTQSKTKGPAGARILPKPATVRASRIRAPGVVYSTGALSRVALLGVLSSGPWVCSREALCWVCCALSGGSPGCAVRSQEALCWVRCALSSGWGTESRLLGTSDALLRHMLCTRLVLIVGGGGWHFTQGSSPARCRTRCAAPRDSSPPRLPCYYWRCSPRSSWAPLPPAARPRAARRITPDQVRLPTLVVRPSGVAVYEECVV